MKVDRSKIRKLQSDVPLESQELIDCIKSAAVGRDLHKVLGSMKHWPVGKCELLHWVDVLDILDDVLAENAKRTSFWSLRSDNDKAETRGLLLAVLNFTALLVEHSYSRHLYSSVEHLIALMGSSDLDVVLSVLNLFYVFSKRSTFIQKLPVNLKAPLITNLLAIANGYGGRANHLDIASCCKLHITERVRLAIDACENVVFTIPAEFFPPERGLVSIQIENVKHAVNQTSTSKPGALMDEMIRHYGLEPLLQNPFQIAAEKSAQTLLYELFNRIRLAFYFGQRNTRILCIEARLQALSILMYSNLASEQTHILLYPGIIKEFSECLFLENTTDLIDAKSGVLKCLTSVIHLERHVNHAEIVEIMQIASYHGFLPDLVRTCVRQLTSKDENAPVRFPHSFITALFSFLYHLASYDGGSEALISSGTIKTLLEVVGHHDSSDANVMFVTRAVRVLDLITNVEMAAFQQANGVSIFIDRLKYESDQCRITNPFEIRLLRSAEEPTLQSPAPQQKPARTCYHQRGALMKSILNFIKRSINDHSVADTVRHLMEGSLPDSLKHILSNCDYYGSSLFLLTAEIVSQYIFAEPSQMSYLQEIGLCDVLLYSLIKLEIPPTREVLASLPGFLGSLCLNQAGLDTFLRYKPFDRLFKVLLSPNYLSAMRRRRATNAVSQAAADPAMSMVIPSASSHSTAFVLGQAMDELMRHQPSLKESAMESLVGLLDQLIQIGSESSRVLREDSADCPPLFEYINNIARFIEAVLSSNVNSAEHMSEFIRLRGHELLLRVCFLPQIPLNHTGPPIALALSGLLRMIIQNLRNDLLIRTLFVSVDPVLSDIQKILKDRLVTHLTPCGQRIDRALAYLNTFTHILLAMLKSSSTEARSITYGLLTIEIGLDFLRRLAEIYGELVVEELVFHSMIFTPTVQSFDVQPYVRKWFETRVWDEIKCERELTDRSYLPGQVVNYTVPIYNHIVRTLRSLAELFAVVNRISATPAAIAQRNRIVFTNGAPHNVLKIINEHLLRNGFAKRENDLERIYCIAHFITFAQSILFDERRRPYHLSLCHFLTFQAETAFFDAMWWLASRIKETPLVDCLVPSNRPPSPTTTTTTNQQQLDAMISEKDVFGHGLALIFCLLDHNVTAKSPYNLTSGEPPFSDVVFTLRMESAANSLVSLVWNNGQTTGPKLNEQLLQIISSIATDREFFGRSIKRPRNIESADLEALELSPNDPGAQIRNQYFQKANNNDSLVQVPVPQIEPPLTQISQLQIYLMNEAVQGQFLNLVENLTRGLLAALDATPDSVHKIREIVSLVAVQHNNAQWIEHFLTQLADRIIEQIKQLPNLDSKTAATASLVLANTLLQERPAHTASVFAKTNVFNHAIELINDESNELFRYLANDNSRYLATLTLFIDLYLCGIRDLQRIVPLHRRCLDQCYCVWKSYDERHGRWLSYNVRQNAMITEAFVQGRSQLRISPNRRHFVVHFNALIQLSDDQRKTRSMALWLIPHTNSELDNKIRLPYGLANLRSAPKLPFFLKSLFGAPYKQPEPFRIADHEPPLEPSQPILQSILRILSAQTQLDSDTVHSSLRIILRLTQTPQNVSHFLNDLNGLEVLASIPSSYSFLGIMSLMIMIIKHVIDTDHNLSYSMEKFIRYSMNSQNGRNPSVNSSGATREIYALMRALTPLICRNPTVSMETILRTLKVTEPSMSDIEDISNGYGTIMVGLRRNETGVHFKACPQTQRVINFLLDLVHRAPSTAVLSKSAILRILSELVRSYSGLGNLVMSHGTFAEIVDRYVDSDDETAPYARLLVTTIASSTNSVLGQKQLIAQIQFSLRKCVDQIVGAEATVESLAKYQAIAGLASLVVHACSSSQRASAAGHVQFLNALKESGLIEDLVGVLTKVPLNCANENVIQTVHCVVRTIDNVTKPFYQAKNGAVATRNQPEQQQQPEVEPPTAAEEANPSAYVRIEHDEAGAAHLAIGVDSLTVNENDEELAPADDDGDDDEEETLGEDAADVEDDTEASVDDDDDDDETAPESTVARYSDCDEEHDEEDEVELRNPEVLQAEDDDEEEEYSSDSDVEMHDALDDDVEMEEEEDANPDEEGQADSRPEDDVLGFLDEIDDDYEGDEIDMDEDDGFAGTGAPAVDGDEDEVLDDEDDEEDEEEEDEDEEEPVEEHIHFQLDIPPRIGHSGWLLGGGDDDETLGGTGPNGIYDLYSRYSENGAAMNSWITSAAHAACLAALTTEQSSAQNVGQLHLLVTNNSLVNSAANAVAAAATAGSTIPYGANLVTSLMTTNSIPQNANPSVIASAAASAAAAAITYSSSLPLIHPILLRRPAEFENFVQSTGGRRSQLIRPNRPNDAFFTASRAAAQAVSNSIGFNRPFPAAHPRFLAVGEMIHSAAGTNQQRFTATARMPGGRNDQHPRADDGITRNPVSAILNDLGLNNIPRTAEPAQMSFPTHASSTAAAAADVLLAPVVRWIEECSIVDGSAFHLSTILLRQELIIKLYAEVESTFEKKLSEYSTSTRQLSAESEPRAAPETLYEDEETQAGQEGHEDDEDIITQDEDEEMVVEEVHHQQDDVEMSEEQPATTLTQQVESAETGETQPPPLQNTTEETLAVSSAANDEGPVEYFDVTIEGHTYTVPSWVDRSFLQELPHNIRLEVIQQQTRIARTRERQQQAATAATVADDESAAMPEISEEVLTSMGISIDFLDELPQNIRAEVLEGLRVQEANRIRSEEVRIEDLATNADPTQFLRSLNPQLRNQLLSELEESQLAALPEDLASEANALRVQSFRNLAVRAGGGHRRTFLRGLRSRGGAGILLNPHRVENLEMFRWALEDEDFNQLGPFDMAPRVFRGLGLARRGARLGAGGMVHVGHGSGAPLRNHNHHNQLQIPLENVPNVELSDESISILLVNLFLGDNRSHNSRIQRVIRNIMTNPPQMCQLIRSLCMILARCTGQIEIVLGHAKIPEGELILVEPCWLKLTRPGPFGKRVPSFSMYKQLTKPPLPYPTYICLDEHASSEVCRHALEIITYLINIAHDKFVMLKLDQELMKSGDIFWRDVICAELKFAENEMDIPRIYGTPGYEDQNTDTTVFAHLISLVHHPIIRYNLSLLDTLFGILGQLSYQLDKYIVVASGTNNGKCFRPKPANSAASGQQDLPRYEGIVFEEQIEAIVDVLVDQNPVFQYGSIKGNTLSNLTDVLTSFTHFNKATHDRILDLTLKGVTTIGLDLEKEIRLLYEESSVFEMFDSNDQADAEEVDDETQPQQQPPETASSSKSLNVPAMDPFVIKHSTQQFFLCVLRVVIDLKRSDIVDLNDPPTYLSSSLDLGELWRALDDCLLQLQSLSDPQTVLLLQPSVEAFFLVHAPVSQLTGRRRRLPDARTEREQRALNLAHLTSATSASANEPADEQQPQQAPQPEAPTAQSSLPSGLNVTYSEMAIRERVNPTADETQRNRNLFLSFANSHSKVLNHILRQSQGSLIDGPFSVLCEYTHILDFDVKRKYFQEELNQLRSNNLREDVSVNVRRDHLFEDSYRELNRRSADDWKRRFYISFEGEEGQDAGGLLREWYCVISKEIFNPNYALFMINPSDRVTYMPNPASHANSNHLSYFKFVGRVIAKAIFDSKHLDCYFTRFFYKHILGVSVDYSDMESVDHDFYKNLCLILKTDASAYELNFSTDVQEFGATKTVDLKENGRNIAVTNENKQEYVRLLCHEKMIGSIRSQLLAFLDGFYSIIPKRLISIFDEHELELLISGLPDIDVEDLRQNTDYHKYRANSLQIQWLWRALRSFEKDDLAKFVQFVTGTSKVPLGGFAHLEGMNGPQKMQIHRDERSSDRLPCAHTCFNQLDLPVYETYEKLRQRLLTAIHECQIGFGLA